jgi:FkbM family methyltransferase
MSMKLFDIVALPLTWLTKQYVIRSPIAHGKGVIVRRLAPRLPLRYREFVAELPGDGSVVLRFDEWIGRHYLLHDSSFEAPELEFMRDALDTGATAIDVGANVGVFTVTAGLCVGEDGHVIAVEADEEYRPRLCANLERNALENTEIIAAAAGDADGEVELIIADDGAFSSIKPLVSYSGSGATRRIPYRRLDSIWADAGEPDVAFVKIDVEGAEVEVVDGAEQLLRQCHPALVVEVREELTEPEVRRRLVAIGYEDVTPSDFGSANRAYRMAS